MPDAMSDIQVRGLDTTDVPAVTLEVSQRGWLDLQILKLQSKECNFGHGEAAPSEGVYQTKCV